MNLSTPIENRASLSGAEFTELAEKLASHRSIKHALDWLIAHKPSLSFSDIVAQDEFSHDVIAPYLAQLYLVYDVT